MPKEKNTVKYKPFIKWRGGKTQLIPTIIDRMPKEFETYHEPFLGGGAVFFGLRAHFGGDFHAVLSDSNYELMLTYEVVKTDPQELMKRLDTYQDNSDYYYHIRDVYEPEDEYDLAARFIYLNKTGFNGLYRVNSKGKFNVAYGPDLRSGRSIYDQEVLRLAHEALQNTTLKATSYKKIHLDQMTVKDFVYFDPPYYGTDVKYTFPVFDESDQAALADITKALAARGIGVMVSNTNRTEVHTLYDGLCIEPLVTNWTINRDSTKRTGAGKEVLITGGYTNDKT